MAAQPNGGKLWRSDGVTLLLSTKQANLGDATGTYRPESGVAT